MSDIILKVENIVKRFPVAKGFLESLINKGEKKYVHAVEDVSFDLYRHKTFSLVGETGSGKTTIAKLILKLMKPTQGKILFEGNDINFLNKKEEKKFRREVQMIFQDPYISLNPRKNIFDIVSTSMKTQRWGSIYDRKERVSELLNLVGLIPPDEIMNRYPHEFSGGQKQRIGIARALAFTPKLIVADEPVSSLDVSIQAQILNLINDIKKEFGITLLLIAHDLAVVKHMSDTVGIMYLGELCELSPSKELFNFPIHPYTKALIASVPVPNPDFKKEILKIGDEMPSPIDVPSGCPFHPRCPHIREICKKIKPKLMENKKGRFVACHVFN